MFFLSGNVFIILVSSTNQIDSYIDSYKLNYQLG